VSQEAVLALLEDALSHVIAGERVLTTRLTIAILQALLYLVRHTPEHTTWGT
jgi:hypothetical protein